MKQQTSIKLKSLAPTVLRIGVALVFLWFGTQQLTNTDQWLRLIPQFIVDFSGLSAATIVHISGVFEIIFGIALLIGFYTRTAALLLALHIIDITFIVGYGPTGVRDFGISIATIAVFLYGADYFTVDRKLGRE
ncbi:MAG: DoxX [Candidatus Parcubacteria bacterium]|jgi:uncharacterized membrane protein YphA (DoxX/SURF4 family)